MYLVGNKSETIITADQLMKMVVCHKQHTLHQIFVELYGFEYDTIPQLRADFIYLLAVLCKIPGNEIRSDYELTHADYIKILSNATVELEDKNYMEIIQGIYQLYNININQN